MSGKGKVDYSRVCAQLLVRVYLPDVTFLKMMRTQGKSSRENTSVTLYPVPLHERQVTFHCNAKSPNIEFRPTLLKYLF